MRFHFSFCDLGSAYGMAIRWGDRTWLIPVFRKRNPNRKWQR